MSKSEDITIAPISARIYDKPFKFTPIYLVKIDNGIGEKPIYLLSTKIEETISTIKIVGVEIIKNNISKLATNYQEVLSSIDKSLFIELSVPWHRIIRIQNLTYKHK
jgi:hypothetical protein